MVNLEAKGVNLTVLVQDREKIVTIGENLKGEVVVEAEVEEGLVVGKETVAWVEEVVGQAVRVALRVLLEEEVAGSGMK